MKKWVCTEWESNPDAYDSMHVFDEATADGFCPCDPPYHGILVYKDWTGGKPETPEIVIIFPVDDTQFTVGNSITISTEASVKEGDISKVEFFVDGNKIGEDDTVPYTFNYTFIADGKPLIKAKAWTADGNTSETSVKVTVKKGPGPIHEIGLSIILMDSSASMREIAFEGSPLSRMRLVATTAAAGIFDLERMHNNPNAFVAGFKFDDSIEMMFLDTVANLIDKYDKDVRKFAAYIYDEMDKMGGGTDINQALDTAHSFVDKFMKKQLPNFPRKDYNPMVQRILRYKSTQSVAIPNVRVLIYTDGMQYDTNGSKILHDNPFKRYPIDNVNHDIVIGAFFGKENDEGCQELKGLLSRCPIHDVEQFFLFDKPDKIGNLKYLFRMASGASGFCPRCLEKELR